MPNWNWEVQEDGTALLELAGEATVESVEELRQLMLQGLDNYEHLEVSCGETATMDFYTIQLLCSAHRTAVARNKLLDFRGEPSAAVSAALRTAGFIRNEGCHLCPDEVRCLWV